MRFRFQARASGRVSGRIHVKSTRPKPSLKDNRVRAGLGPCRVRTKFESGFSWASPPNFGLSGSFYTLLSAKTPSHPTSSILTSTEPRVKVASDLLLPLVYPLV
ncbi:hypothetical protein TorRG33x02_336890 [Trema orientale]|uniref:Uncharacterized protein n=1 Tax=Trema orientale TaxID=63057 RepID=A0A2P5AZM6_TREOI|nr:hypothetical protein TorRG33x02_336890 [Trema orientale]